ncbi:MAG: aldehyde dehydrogenase family protein [Verrucomicrobiae bacterium]|nr:aldehyde dehydrogenase family protein [Verrucomicrobiae bacterium]
MPDTHSQQLQTKLLIGDRWTDAASGRTFASYNPATGDVITHVAEGGKEDIERAVRAARAAFEGPWRKMSPMERSKCLWKLADLIEKNFDALATLETMDAGKTINECRAIDLPMTIDQFRYMSGWATKIEGSTFTPSVSYAPGAQWFAYAQRQPIGVVGAIIPWNFPLIMASWKLAPALAAGCTVVLKPAEQTPLSALRLGELCLEAGIPPGVVNIVNGFGETAGAALAAHPDVDKVAFTGSTEVGRLIAKAAAGSNLKKVSLELGGKSPQVLFADADLDSAIPGVVGAVFFHHGQCCISGTRLYVEQKIYAQVIDGLAERVGKFKLGDGLDPTTTMGPLVSAEQQARVCCYLEAGKREGARVAVGGNLWGDQGYFVEPTIFADTRDHMKIMQEEIFGPVLSVTSFEDINEVLNSVNATPYGLAAGIWSGDLAKARQVADHVLAGTVWINCWNIFDPSLPFGGFKQSGWGRENGHQALDLYTETKTVISPR